MALRARFTETCLPGDHGGAFDCDGQMNDDQMSEGALERSSTLHSCWTSQVGDLGESLTTVCGMVITVLVRHGSGIESLSRYDFNA